MYFSGAGKSMHPGVEASVTVTSVDQIHTQFHAVSLPKTLSIDSQSPTNQNKIVG
jgi:hypothetical protein